MRTGPVSGVIWGINMLEVFLGFSGHNSPYFNAKLLLQFPYLYDSMERDERRSFIYKDRKLFIYSD